MYVTVKVIVPEVNKDVFTKPIMLSRRSKHRQLSKCMPNNVKKRKQSVSIVAERRQDIGTNHFISMF